MAEGNLPPAAEPSPETGNPQDPFHQPATVAPQAPAATSPSPAKRKRRRRWPWVLLALFLLLGLLVVLLPTLAGTGPGRSVILGQVNQRLNGRVEVADWSMGWSSP